MVNLRDAHQWTAAAAHHHPLLDQIVPALGLETQYMEERPDSKSLEKCSVGITACDALIGQTGSILLTARSAGGRALSVLPPHHLVIARADQLVPDLPAAFELLRHGTRKLPQFYHLHHWPESDRRHRANSGLGRPWSQEPHGDPDPVRRGEPSGRFCVLGFELR